MKHFRSERAFQKYKPEESWQKKFARFFRKKQRVISISEEPSHRLSNPYKPHNRPKAKTGKFTPILLFILIIGWIFCLAYTPYFKIKKVLYIHLTNTSKAELENFINSNYLQRQSWLPVSNYFFISPQRLAQDIKKHFSLEDAEVTKVFPDQLQVEVKEKVSVLIYDNGKKYFLLDKEGRVIKSIANVEENELKTQTAPLFDQFTETSSSSPENIPTSTIIMTSTIVEHTPNNSTIKQFFSKYPLVYDRRGVDVSEKQTGILPADYIAAILAWNTHLVEQGKIRPKFFLLDNLNSGMIINTNQPWYIIFQPKNNIENQIMIFDELLPTIKPKAYIDLRFGEKIYWK